MPTENFYDKKINIFKIHLKNLENHRDHAECTDLVLQAVKIYPFLESAPFILVILAKVPDFNVCN
jgi:hypothetical protein